MPKCLSFFKYVSYYEMLFYTYTINSRLQIPWRRKWQAAPVFLPGKSHGQKSLVATLHEFRYNLVKSDCKVWNNVLEQLLE